MSPPVKRGASGGARQDGIGLGDCFEALRGVGRAVASGRYARASRRYSLRICLADALRSTFRISYRSTLLALAPLTPVPPLALALDTDTDGESPAGQNVEHSQLFGREDRRPRGEDQHIGARRIRWVHPARYARVESTSAIG
jgi:hypothetical protein